MVSSPHKLTSEQNLRAKRDLRRGIWTEGRGNAETLRQKQSGMSGGQQEGCVAELVREGLWSNVREAELAVGHSKNLDFYPRCDMRTLAEVKQGNGLRGWAFCKDRLDLNMREEKDRRRRPVKRLPQLPRHQVLP